METKKSHDLPPANWRPRKASGIIQSESKGLSTWEASGVSPTLSPNAWKLEGNCVNLTPGPKVWEPGVPMSKSKRRWMFQLKQREQICPASAFLFYWDPHQIGLYLLILWGWSALLSQPIQMLTSSGSTLTATLRKYVLPAIWSSLCPVKLTRKSNHHNENSRTIYLPSLHTQITHIPSFG